MLKELYNTLLSINYNDYNVITAKKKENISEKYNRKNLLLKVQRSLNQRKKKKVNHSQNNLLLKE